MNTLKRLAVVVFGFLVLAGCANSTPGVTVVGDNVVNLPAGERAEFSGSNGKYYLTWSVTFDASVGEVNVHCTGACFNGKASVPNIGSADWANSSSFFGRFDVTRVSADAVELHWPFGVTLQ